MKYFCTTLFLCLLLSIVVNAAPKYWVGPLNGDWSNTANWSDMANGPGGAALPGTLDSVIFSNNTNYLVHVDLSPTISSMSTNGSVTLYTFTPVVFRILTSLYVPYFTTLKDSTSADVSFNMVFTGATKATGTIYGDWVFEGSVPLGNVSGSGAMFTAEPGAVVTVISRSDPSSSRPNYQSYKGGEIIFKRNTGTISSDITSLLFSYNTNYILDNNLDAQIPAATWNGDQLAYPDYSGSLLSPAASLQIKGNTERIRYTQPVPNLAKVVIDLPVLGSDLDLSLPDGTSIRGNLEIYNTNGHTLTLLSATGSNGSVNVQIGVSGTNTSFSGVLLVTGNTTKVALARSATNPATDYHLKVWKDFSQSGGNFSLQDYDGATGTSTLELSNNLTQTGGTFYTNSTSTQAKFAVAMNDPPYITGPSGDFYSYRTISMSSGTIDNAAHMVTLQINHGIHLSNGYEDNPNGVGLLTPLSVGKLELIQSPLTTSAVNILTVNNPSPDAITIGGLSSCCTTFGFPTPQTTSTNYINGPFKRATNSTAPYFFPTGKGYNFSRNLSPQGQNFARSFHSDSCYVLPASSAPSVYQAEYFQAGYADFQAGFDSTVAAPLTKVSNAEYWKISKVSGANASVRLFLSGAAVPGAAASDALVTAGYENSHWVADNGTLLSPGNATTGSVTSKVLSTPGLFTFGYGDPAKLNPVNNTVFNGLNYKYYEGGYSLMPDFNTLTPVNTGNSPIFDLGIRRSGINDSFAIVWEGYINIPAAGSYTFETVSDDGSRLYFNSLYTSSGVPLVDNDGTHPPQTVTGTINVPAAGRYPITVTYFETYGDQSLQVYWTGPGIPRQQIPAAAFTDGVTVPVASGLNYKYYEGDFNILPDFSTLTPVKTGTSPNVDISLRAAGVDDHFAFVWDGTITIPTAGTYTFETVSDDGSKLYFNGNGIVNNDGLHPATSVTGTVTVPAAGTYPISISFFEKDGGQSMQVYWTGPGIPRQLIPDAAFGSGTITPPAGNGLNYKYYEGDFNTLPDFSTLTPVKTGTSANVDISIRPTGVDDHFAFVWEGTIYIPTAGTYTFETISDDGSKVYFNMPYSASGNSLVTNDGLHAPNSATGTVTVPTAGTYPITITYFEKDGGQTMELYWTGPGIARQLIPDAAFGSGTAAAAIPGGLNYKYYEGDFDMLPDYSILTPVKTGTTNNVDIGIRPSGVNDHFAFIWDGYINLPSAGTYTFETISDDGSKVYFNMPYSLNGNSLVNNDGLHAPNSATGTITVASAGRYPISITFFEKDGGETMQLYWTGPGISRQLIPDAAFTTTNTANGTVVMSGSAAGALNGMPGATTATKVYPNPFVESFTIDYYNEGSIMNNISIGLYDLNGKLIYNYQPANLVVGYNRWMVNIGAKNLAAGVYIAQIKVNGIPSKTIKLVKTKK